MQSTSSCGSSVKAAALVSPEIAHCAICEFELPVHLQRRFAYLRDQRRRETSIHTFGALKVGKKPVYSEPTSVPHRDRSPSLQVIAALAAIPQPRMELQPARSAGKRWLRALQSPELRVSRGAGVSVATTSTRLRTCGRCLSGRAGTHRFEHDRYQLRACSPVQTCASKAERVYRVGSRRGARGGALASSPEDQRRTGPSAKLELRLLEAVWHSTPVATQIHAHLRNFWHRRRRSRTSRHCKPDP